MSECPVPGGCPTCRASRLLRIGRDVLVTVLFTASAYALLVLWFSR